MPSVNTLNSGDSRTLEAPVHSIRVDTGTVTVTNGTHSDVVDAGDTLDLHGTANCRVHAVSGTRFVVTTTDEAPEPTPKKAPVKKAKK